MSDFGQFLTAYERALGFTSDNQLALHLKVSRQYVSKLRNNGKASDTLCIEIADRIGVERGIVLLARDAARHTGPVGDALKALLGKVAGVGLLIGASLICSHLDGGNALLAASNPLILLVKITGSICIALLFSQLRANFAFLTRLSFR